MNIFIAATLTLFVGFLGHIFGETHSFHDSSILVTVVYVALMVEDMRRGR